jgi:hypothetical protein
MSAAASPSSSSATTAPSVLDFFTMNAVCMKRFLYLIGKEQERVSWKTIASLFFHRVFFLSQKLDDEFREFVVRSLIATRNCKTAFAVDGWKKITEYYALEVETLYTHVHSTQKAHKMDLEDACLSVIEHNRKRFEYVWKKFHGTKCA